jgi:hypothetical protein
MAYDTSNGKYHRLTRNYYYRACGMKRLVKKSNERNLKRKGVYDAMSRSPTKSIREEDWYAYQLVIIRNYDTLWKENAMEQRRRKNFKVKRLKEKCLDQFLNQRRREATDGVWSGQYEPVRKGRAGSSGEIRIRKV